MLKDVPPVRKNLLSAWQAWVESDAKIIQLWVPQNPCSSGSIRGRQWLPTLTWSWMVFFWFFLQIWHRDRYSGYWRSYSRLHCQRWQVCDHAVAACRSCWRIWLQWHWENDAAVHANQDLAGMFSDPCFLSLSLSLSLSPPPPPLSIWSAHFFYWGGGGDHKSVVQLRGFSDISLFFGSSRRKGVSWKKASCSVYSVLRTACFQLTVGCVQTILLPHWINRIAFTQFFFLSELIRLRLMITSGVKLWVTETRNSPVCWYYKIAFTRFFSLSVSGLHKFLKLRSRCQRNTKALAQLQCIS